MPSGLGPRPRTRISSMNTSSSDAAIGRTLVTVMPSARSAAVSASTPRPGSTPASRTCARSPNDCTSATPCHARQRVDGRARRRRDHFEQLAAQHVLQRGRLVEREQVALVQERDARAALGLVQIGRRHQDREAATEELGEQLPELAPRHGIDAGRRLVEQEDPRLVHERAGERELLLHAARQPIGAAGAERRQLRHLEQPVARRLEVDGRRGSRRRTRCSRRCSGRRRG